MTRSEKGGEYGRTAAPQAVIEHANQPFFGLRPKLMHVFEDDQIAIPYALRFSFAQIARAEKADSDVAPQRGQLLGKHFHEMRLSASGRPVKIQETISQVCLLVQARHQ